MRVVADEPYLTVTSSLRAPREVVWQGVTTAAGIRDEMRPVMRMTLPGGLERLDQVTLGEPLGRSWLLLFGLLPFDYDDITLVKLEEGRGFLERSSMLSQRLWEHERTLVDTPQGGCVLTDRLRWEPRLGLPAAPLQPLIRAFFGHRHRRLRRRFGGEPVGG